MHQGNWKCSSCGGAITELPFEPRSESGLTCRACYGKQKERDNQQAPEMPSASETPDDMPLDARPASEPAPAEFFEPDDIGTNANSGAPASSADRPKFSGDWKCAICGNTISSLPFQPRDTSNLKCLDCFKKSKS